MKLSIMIVPVEERLLPQKCKMATMPKRSCKALPSGRSRKIKK